MTLTRPQRAALKLAIEYMKSAEMRKAQWLKFNGINTSNDYRELVEALQVIEEMLRGVQTEMKI